MPEPISGWSEFFVAEVGAAAALSGLVIVAISINLQRILDYPQLPGRAGEALAILVGALLVASVGLFPRQSPRVFGAEVAMIGLWVWTVSALLQIHSFRLVKDQPTDWWLPRLLVSLGTALPIVVGGGLLMIGWPGGIYFIAVGVLLSLVAGVVNTWILLIEILR
jgi:hypothetical protein